MTADGAEAIQAISSWDRDRLFRRVRPAGPQQPMWEERALRLATKTNTYLKAARTLLAAASILAVASGAAMAEPSGTLRFGASFDLPNWNPQVQTNLVYVQPVYEALLELAPDGATIQPRLATEWSTEGNKTTFKLRQGVVFHDGTPFNADAVIANIDNVKASTSRWADTVANIVKMEKVDDYTVTLESAGPNPSLPFLMTQFGLDMISPKALADGSWMTKPVGTGPYVYDEAASIPGSKYVFTLFDKYYALDEVGLAGIEVHYLGDTTARFNAVVSGQIDASEGHSSQEEQVVELGLKSEIWPALRYHLSFLDRKDTFANPLVRKAMCMALPREDLIAIRNGQAKAVSQRFDAGDPAHVEGLQDYSYDIEGAKKLMDEAGNPKVSFKFPTFDRVKDSDVLIQAAFAQIGIEMELVTMPPSEYFASTYSGKYPLYFNNFRPERGGMFNYYPFLFGKEGKGNMFKVDPPADLEAMYREALVAPLDKQPAILQNMTRFIHDTALDCGFLDLNYVINYDPKRVSEMASTYWEPSAPRYKDVRMVD